MLRRIVKARPKAEVLLSGEIMAGFWGDGDSTQDIANIDKGTHATVFANEICQNYGLFEETLECC